MNTTFMNSEISKRSDIHRLLLNLTDKTYQFQHGIKNLNYLMDQVL